MDEVQSRLSQVFNYIKALNEIRNPVKFDIKEQLWSLWVNDIPEHDCITINDDLISGALSFIFKVKRPKITSCPLPSDDIKTWLVHGWDDIDKDPQKINSKTMLDESGQNVDIYFEDDTARVESYNSWIKVREQWKKIELPARQTSEIFARLYRLYSILQKEPETVELALGDGLLNYPLENGDIINHPILIQKAELLFDSAIPEFTIKLVDGQTEMYTALLRLIQNINAIDLGKCLDELESENHQIFDEENTSEFLKRTVISISYKGEFVDKDIPRGTKEHPEIARRPVVFLRKRNLGFAAMIGSILTDIPENDKIPSFISNIVGVNGRDSIINYQNTSEVDILSSNGEDQDILLSKPANAEQLLVAKQLEANGAVLVQGPPGTGKTHTIANLIGHLLSQGKSILVTSQSEKALRVLRDKVVLPLQALCLPVLSNSMGTNDMEKTLDEMNERRSIISITKISKELNSLELERKEVLSKLKTKRDELKLSRANEYRSIVVSGNEYNPSDAAKYVRENRDGNDWIPSPVLLGEPLILSESEIRLLYQTNNTLTPVDELECCACLPDVKELPMPNQFESIINQKYDLENKELHYKEQLWDAHIVRNLDNLKYILEQVYQADSYINANDKWQLDILQSAVRKEAAFQQWNILISDIEDIVEKFNGAYGGLIEYAPSTNLDLVNYDNLTVLDEIIEYLNSGGKLNKIKLLTKSKWRKMIEGSLVNNNTPTKIDHFKIIRQSIDLQLSRYKLKQRWERQVGIYNNIVADSTDNIEMVAQRYISFIKRNLEWYDKEWQPLMSMLITQGFQWQSFEKEQEIILDKYGDILTIKNKILPALRKIVEQEINRDLYSSVLRYFNQLKVSISTCFNSNIKVLTELVDAIEYYDASKFEKCYQRIIELSLIKDKVEQRRALISKLKSVAPTWGEQVENRVGVHGNYTVPGDIMAAWKWRQLNDELDCRSSLVLNMLQKEISDLEIKLRNITAIIVEKKSWKALYEKMTFEQIQAIQGWRMTMKSIGKGTGKRVPKLLTQARELMPECQSAVPVWIMPLSRVAENFDPRKNKFDVVIIDEASQADITALAAIYLGNQIVIVGDDEQVSPMGVGQKIDEVDNLIDTFLEGIPNKHLYTGQFSVYDLAQMAGFQPVCLKEHFRCLTPIIQFSNHLSYNGQIKPLRDDSIVTVKPATIAYRVENASSEDKVNLIEAETIASLLIACTEFEEYRDKTFGVITMVGERQALIIDEILQKRMNPAEYVKRKIQCGNSAHFQGDERDIIFISIVDTPLGSGPLSLRAEGTQNMFKKRYNVAASRAGEQMWVVHSLNPDIDLKDGDIRLRLIKHAENPSSIDSTLDNIERYAESIFEKQVMKYLTEKEYKVIPQWKVGAYRIDMVVEGCGKRLAIECDGEQWHKHEDLTQDMQRQAILERLGWRFERIRGSLFFRDPEKAMKRVFERLEELEISPELNKSSEIQVTENELLNRLIARASELRIEWRIDGKDSKFSYLIPIENENREIVKISSPPEILKNRLNNAKIFDEGDPLRIEVQNKGVKINKYNKDTKYKLNNSIEESNNKGIETELGKSSEEVLDFRKGIGTFNKNIESKFRYDQRKQTVNDDVVFDFRNKNKKKDK